MDIDLRGLERAWRSSGSVTDFLRYRSELKRSGNLGDLNTIYPRVWEVIGAEKDQNLTYGECLARLRALCRDDSGFHPFLNQLTRPLTFKEMIQARLDECVLLGGPGPLWRSWLDTSTAIVWKKGGNEFKIVPLSTDLLEKTIDFRGAFLPVKYSDFERYTEYTVDATYDRGLSQAEVVEHQGWLAAFGGDNKENRELLRRYSAIAFAAMNRTPAMRFWTVGTIKEDQLRALCAGFLDLNCNCYGDGDLNYDARFARVRSL